MIAEAGGSAVPFQADVSRDADCAAVIAEARSRWGRIDILVNNVGIGGGGDGPAHRADEEAFDRILNVNLKSAWMTIKHVVPVMREQGGGSIVNISSLASLAGGNQVAYEVSKAGMNRLTTSVANANASYGVRCNAVLPGLMDTPMAITGIAEATGSTTAAVREARNARVPLARQDGNRLGHRARRAVPRLGRGQFHHRRAAARGRRDGSARRLTRRCRFPIQFSKSQFSCKIVIPGRCEASNYDVQLHIGESRDSPMRNCASEVWC